MRATVSETAARADTVRVDIDLGRNEPAWVGFPAVRTGRGVAEVLEEPVRGRKTDRPDPRPGFDPTLPYRRHLSMIPLLETPSGFP